ncbi:MAG TPA: hypothetical protein VLW50_12945 [Streptosporangiaceae bacterium]|nr:hypothetical protein [Streptosporangiaceae bacterium]
MPQGQDRAATPGQVERLLGAAEAMALPQEIVRRAIYPVTGTRTLANIILEANANEKAFSTRVRTKLRGLLLPPLPAPTAQALRR